MVSIEITLTEEESLTIHIVEETLIQALDIISTQVEETTLGLIEIIQIQ